jgi:YD repeat-containing protein
MNLSTAYEYDALGRSTKITDANHVDTVVAYDRKGQVLTRTVDPSGLALRSVYSYDARGRTLTVESPGHTVARYVYDSLGRRTEEHTDPQGLDIARFYGYDQAGNLAWAKDPNGNLTRYAYDAKDRLVITLDAAGGAVVNTYDATDRLLRRTGLATPLAGVNSLALVPDWAVVRQQLHYDAAVDSTQLNRYDHDGRLRFTVDGAGGVSERRYDGNGNVIEWIGYAKALASVPATDDPNWVPAPQASATDQHVASVYDALDRAVYTVDAVGAIVKQAFDGNGNVTDRVAYAAKHPEALGASKAALDSLTAAMAPDNADAHTRLRYDAADRLVYSVDGVGAVTRYAYDNNGNVLS